MNDFLYFYFYYFIFIFYLFFFFSKTNKLEPGISNHLKKQKNFQIVLYFYWVIIFFDNNNKKKKNKQTHIGSSYLFDYENQIDSILKQHPFAECHLFTCFNEEAHQTYLKNVIVNVFE